MSNLFKQSKLIGLLLCSTLFTACSERVAGIEGTGDSADDLIAAKVIAANGSVTKFGSIYVNGIHFNTDNTRFLINGEDVGESDIKQGMVVYVKGKPGASDAEANAELVTFDYIVQGVIEDIVNDSSDQRTISMLGYTILSTEEAMAEDGAFDQLGIGDHISVSGFTNGDNQIVATRIDLKNEGDLVSVSGRVSTHSINEMIFTINEQIVDYSQGIFINGDTSAIKIGLSVKVEGNIQPESSTITASKIKFTKKEAIDKPRNFSVEGVITDFTSTGNFRLNGAKVDASTAKITGNTNSPIDNGRRITIKGKQSNNDIFIASSLHLHHASATRISGPVSNIQAKAGTFTVSGIEFNVDKYTKFEDLGPRHNRYFNLEDIAPEDNLDIFSLTYDDKHIAITVRRKPQSYGHELKIKGVISSFTEEKSFYLMDILVNAENIPDEIFNELTLDTAIFITGEFSDNKIFTAQEIYILKSNCTSHKERDCSKQRSVKDYPKNGGSPQPR